MAVMDDFVGKKFRHYHILTKLGQGGMGIVYKARDITLKRLVALKFLPQKLTLDSKAKERFRYEAQCASSIDHPNICTIHDICETKDQQTFIVMSYYEGETLKAKIEGQSSEKDQSPQLSLYESLNIVLQIAQGLAAAHLKGIVHCDLKPNNIYICNNGLVKILDFGIAQLVEPFTSFERGSTLGNLAYMSPEQILKYPFDHRSDIWSFGVVFYQLVTGQCPFRGEIDQTMMYSIVNDDYKPLSLKPPRVSREIGSIVQKCLEKDPEKRYSFTWELIDDLQNVKERHFRVKSGKFTRLRHQFKSHFLLSIFVLIVLMGMLFGLYRSFVKPLLYPENYTVVLSDFQLDGSLPEYQGSEGVLAEVFRRSLEKSGIVNVVSRIQMLGVVSSSKATDKIFFDEDTGKIVCNLLNVRYLIIPYLTKIGDGYVFRYKLFDRLTSKYLSPENAFTFYSLPELQDRATEINYSLSKFLKTLSYKQSFPPKGSMEISIDAARHFFEAENCIHKVHYLGAEKELLETIRIDSTYGPAYYWLAFLSDWLYGNPIRTAEYVAEAQKYLARSPQKERQLLTALELYLEQGPDRAFQFLEALQNRYTNDVEYLTQLGEYAFQANQFEKASTYLTKALAFDSLSERTLQRLCLSYEKLNQDELFDRTIQKLIFVNRNTAYHTTGWRMFRAHRYEQAKRMFLTNIAADSVSPSGLMGLMCAYLQLENSDSAFYYAKKYSRVTFSFEGFSQLVAVFARTNQVAEGLKWLIHLRELKPQLKFEISLAMTDLLIYEEQFSDAKQLMDSLTQYASMSFQKQQCWEMLYKIALYQGQFVLAEETNDRIFGLYRHYGLDWHVEQQMARQAIVDFWYEKPSADLQLTSFGSDPAFRPDWDSRWYYLLLTGQTERADSMIPSPISSSLKQNLFQIRSLLLDKSFSSPESALKLVYPAGPGRPVDTFPIHLILLYHMMEKYLAQGQYELALNSFQLIMEEYDNRDIYRALIFPTAILRRAQLAEKMNQLTEACEYYDKFISLWQHTDAPDVLAKAKYHYRRLLSEQKIEYPK